MGKWQGSPFLLEKWEKEMNLITDWIKRMAKVLTEDNLDVSWYIVRNPLALINSWIFLSQGCGIQAFPLLVSHYGDKYPLLSLIGITLCFVSLEF